MRGTDVPEYAIVPKCQYLAENTDIREKLTNDISIRESFDQSVNMYCHTESYTR